MPRTRVSDRDVAGLCRMARRDARGNRSEARPAPHRRPDRRESGRRGFRVHRLDRVPYTEKASLASPAFDATANRELRPLYCADARSSAKQGPSSSSDSGWWRAISPVSLLRSTWRLFVREYGFSLAYRLRVRNASDLRSGLGVRRTMPRAIRVLAVTRTNRPWLFRPEFRGGRRPRESD